MGEQALVPQIATAPPSADTLLSVIASAAADPRVDVQKMQALVDLKLQVERESAAQEFSAAMARLQPRLPRIAKKGMISVPGKEGRTGHQTPFARYEDILKVCRPLLAEEGFSTSYSFEETPKGTVCVCTVSHRAGHSKATRTPPLPMDSTGSKNSVQAAGSTMKYGKRYAFCNAFDIVTVDDKEDDDGQAAGFVNQDQANAILDMMIACGINAGTDGSRRFFEFAQASRVEEIQAAHFPAVMEMLRRKLDGIKRGPQR